MFWKMDFFFNLNIKNSFIDIYIYIEKMVFENIF